MKTLSQAPEYRPLCTVRALKIKHVLTGSHRTMLVPEDEEFAQYQVDSAFLARHSPKDGGYLVLGLDQRYPTWCEEEKFPGRFGEAQKGSEA